MKLSVSISSRDWSEFSEKSLPDSLGSTNGGVRLNTPLVGWNAFSATFRVMFVEEFRENLDFAKKRRILLFPLQVNHMMISLLNAMFTIGSEHFQIMKPLIPPFFQPSTLISVLGYSQTQVEHILAMLGMQHI